MRTQPMSPSAPTSVPPQSTQRPHAPAPAAPPGNRLLLALPPDVQQRLQASGTLVALDKEAVLVDAGALQTHIFFPCSGLLSLQTMTQDGNSVEVAMVGREVVAALPFIGASPAVYATSVTVAGEALRLRADALQTEFDRS